MKVGEVAEQAKCPDCHGKGTITEKAQGPSEMMVSEFTCLGCNGSGEGPRFMLISVKETQAVYKVTHTMSGMTLGLVVRMVSGGWAFLCPKIHCTSNVGGEYLTADLAALALGAHDLDHRLAVAKASLPGEVA